MSYPTTYDGAVKFANDIIRLANYLRNLKENVAIKIDGETTKLRIRSNGQFIQLNNTLLFTNKEHDTNIRLSGVDGADFISFSTNNLDEFEYFPANLSINEDTVEYEIIDINSKELFFQYSLVLPQEILISTVIMSILKKNCTDSFYMDLNLVEKVLKELEINEQ